MKYNAFFNWRVLQFYQCDIMSGFCRSGHISYHETSMLQYVIRMSQPNPYPSILALLFIGH